MFAHVPHPKDSVSSTRLDVASDAGAGTILTCLRRYRLNVEQGGGPKHSDSESGFL